MTGETKQVNVWRGAFGKEYTDRNHVSIEKMNEFYLNLYGVTKSKMNQEFLSELSINNILEVGCNVGDQLAFFKEENYKNLYGVELQAYAVEKSKELKRGLNIIQGSGFNIPFKDQFFDLVYTHGVLIHIAPADLPRIINEIYRCSKKYIWGLEYYSEVHQAINYRGNEDLMWKGDFASLFKTQFPNLKLIKHKKYKYIDSDDIDAMYLLEKE